MKRFNNNCASLLAALSIFISSLHLFISPAMSAEVNILLSKEVVHNFARKSSSECIQGTKACPDPTIGGSCIRSSADYEYCITALFLYGAMSLAKCTTKYPKNKTKQNECILLEDSYRTRVANFHNEHGNTAGIGSSVLAACIVVAKEPLLDLKVGNEVIPALKWEEYWRCIEREWIKQTLK